jgi:hypothetical protein
VRTTTSRRGVCVQCSCVAAVAMSTHSKQHTGPRVAWVGPCVAAWVGPCVAAWVGPCVAVSALGATRGQVGVLPERTRELGPEYIWFCVTCMRRILVRGGHEFCCDASSCIIIARLQSLGASCLRPGSERLMAIQSARHTVALPETSSKYGTEGGNPCQNKLKQVAAGRD